MPRCKPVRAIQPTFRFGSGADDILEFICCVGWRQPQIQKLWSSAEDRITREVHPFAQIDVSNFSGDCYHTAYATEIGRRVFIYGRKSINGSVEWLDIPAPSCDTGVAWTENTVVPNPCWGDRRGYGRWDLATHSRPLLGGRSVPCRGVVPFRPDYVPSSPEMHAQGRAASVAFACRRTVWRGIKLSRATSTLAVRSGVIGRTTTWMVGLTNNFCVEILLVVSIAEIRLVV